MITSALVMIAALALGQRCAPRSGRRHADRSRRATRPMPTNWADVADAIGTELRAGHSLRAALHQVVEHRAPGGAVLRRGATLDDVVAARSAEPDELVVVRALQTAVRLGGPAATGLHAAAAVLRERSAARADATAQGAQARASARVLTAVPLVFSALGVLTSSSFRAVIFAPSGGAVAATGAVLNLLGWMWMRRVVRGVTA
jgi:Flp pilus assembly protein TadB